MSDRPEPEPVNQTAASNLEAGRDIIIGSITQNISHGDRESVSGSGLTREDYRNRRDLLKVVKEEVAGRLQQSLHKAALINLHKESQPEQVSPPWSVDVIIGQQTSYPLSPSTEIIEVFKQKEVAGKLLILGAPGSGKTTTQLELAQALITNAENDDSELIPVLFNLSSWKDNNQTITEWLVAELSLKDGVRIDIGRKLVENRQLLLLLDGLDELESKRQEQCVQAINQLLRQNRLYYLVVCSRLEEYESYDTKLQINGAICLKPLTKAQIYQHLVNVEYPELWQGIQDEPRLLDLAKSPLLLSIMTLAYKEISFQEWQELKSARERLEYLLNVYIQRMLKRDIKNLWYGRSNEPKPEQTQRWLAWLAKKLKEQSQTEFLIEKMQPTWLQTPSQKWLYRNGVLLIVGLIVGLPDLQFVFSPFGLIFWLLIGITVWKIIGRVNEEIKPVESLRWSWVNARKGLGNGLIIGGILGFLGGWVSGLSLVLTYGLSNGMSNGMWYGLSGGLGLGLMGGLMGGLIRGLIGPNINIESRTVPNQGIRKSAANAVIFVVIAGLILGLCARLAFGLSFSRSGEIQLICWLCYGLYGGLCLELIGELSYALIGSSNQGSAGLACIQHFTLRVILWQSNCIPWNYARFLNYATERSFLQKVGGRYIFIHRLLLEHLAALEID